MLTTETDQNGVAMLEADLSDDRHIDFFCADDRAHTGPTALQTATTIERTNSSQPMSLDHESARFIELLLLRVGLDAADYRRAPLARRLPACLRSLRVRSIAEAHERLRREPQRVAEALSMLLIGVTQFFREPDLFAYLDQSILSTWSMEKSFRRVWSVGCSDGSELYSVAMLLAARGLLHNASLLGTDCRADAIQMAARGWFELPRLDALAPEFRRAHIVAEQGGGRINEGLRAAVRWEQRNALEEPRRDQGACDLILCRNMAIYLEPAASARLWTHLVGALCAGGILITGKAEWPQQPDLTRLAPCVFQKRR